VALVDVAALERAAIFAFGSTFVKVWLTTELALSSDSALAIAFTVVVALMVKGAEYVELLVVGSVPSVV